MTEPVTPSDLHGISPLIQRISVIRWLITLLLSLRGLYAFYGMKEPGSFEQIITTITDPLVGIFKVEQSGSYTIPGLSVLFALISLLLASYLVQFAVRFYAAWYYQPREANPAEFSGRTFKTYP
jgi:hypothetical protein